MSNMERKNAWKTYDEAQMKELQQLNADYINFLSECKTERECVKDTVIRVEENGYISIEKAMEENKTIQKCDKIYAVCMN